MCAKFKTIIFLLLLLVTQASYAWLEPAFNFKLSAWYATDIAIVSEGNTIDGELAVLEVWKGNLVPGDSLTIPGLKILSTVKNRTVQSVKKIPKSKDKSSIVVSGNRMIVFLKRNAAGYDTKGGKIDSAAWIPANTLGVSILFSVVWIENKKSYTFVYPRTSLDPGIGVLTRYLMSEQEMQAHIKQVNLLQPALAKIASDTNIAQRVVDAAHYIDSKVLYARQTAFAILVSSGDAALPILRKMLRDKSKITVHADIIIAMGSAGGQKMGTEFTKMIEDELQFWVSTAPSLKDAWWTDIRPTGLNMSKLAALQHRYKKVVQILNQLRDMRFQASKDAVRRFRDYWRSESNLKGLVHVSMACDQVLQNLD